MRDVVLVGPGDGGAGLHRQLLRVEGEIVDRDAGVRGVDTRAASDRRRRRRGLPRPRSGADIICSL